MKLPGERTHEGLRNFPPPEEWDSFTAYDAKAHPRKVAREFMLIPTTCFNCESACGLLAHVAKDDLTITKLEGNPAHPGSRGRNCAKGPATINQVDDPERILYPLRQAGDRGSGQWERVTWDEALDDIAGADPGGDRRRPPRRGDVPRRAAGRGRLRRALPARLGRRRAQLAHQHLLVRGTPRATACGAATTGPSPDHANAKAILLLSSHLETGHYFNPHAQRIMEAKASGTKLVVMDPRMSNTASHADLWIAPWPGSEAAILLAVASHLLQTRQIDADYIRRWVNWETYLDELHPEVEHDFEAFLDALTADYAPYTFSFAAAEARVPMEQIAELAEIVAGAGTALSAHVWRSAAAGNLGGWQVSRCLFFLNVLTGSVGTPGGTSPNGWNKFIAHGFDVPEGHDRWNELLWPPEYPLCTNEMSILLPHLLGDDRGHLEVYFSRVYNPIWTNPDGFSWMEALTDRDKVGCHVALTPTWSETATFADYVLPMGHATERHDTHSYETHAGRWLGFRQPVRRVAFEKLGREFADTRDTNPGEVWEENEFWFELSWRIDPDGSLGHPEVLRVAVPAGRARHRRRVLPLGLREPGAGAAGEGGGRGAHPAGLHAQVRRRGDRQGPLPPGRAAVDRRGARRCGRGRARRAPQADRRRVDAAARRGGGLCRRTAGGRVDRRRMALAVAQARAVLADHGVVRVAGARDARLHPLAHRARRAQARPGRDGADPDLPAARP